MPGSAYAAAMTELPERVATRTERTLALLFAGALIAFSVAWALFPHVRLNLSPTSIGVYGSALTLGHVVGGSLLLWRARLFGNRRAAVLAGMYAFATPVATLYAVALLLGGPHPAGQGQISAWLWLDWRLGVPLALIVYAFQPAQRRGGLGWIAGLGLLCGAGAIALAYSAILPDFYHLGVGTLTTAGAIANDIATVVAIVALVCILRLPEPTGFETWIAALLAILAVRCVLGSVPTAHANPSDAVWAFSGLIGILGINVAVIFEFAEQVGRSAALEHLGMLYRREHAIAKSLQDLFVPSTMPDVEGLAFAGVYRPAARESELGGDWYDAFLLRDGRVALSVGDIAGHGVGAAIAMVRLRETLRALATVSGTSAGTILQSADRTFAAEEPETIATAAVALYDPHTRRLEFASAGHPPLALVRAGRAAFINGTTGLPLGVEEESAFSCESVVLEPGDTLVFYTDGLIETTRDLCSGQKHLAEMLETHGGDVVKIVDGMLDGAQRDDVALLQVAVLETAVRSTWYFQCEDASSAADARPSFTKHLRQRNVAPETVYAAELVFGELVGNVVRHAPGPIEIELVWRDDGPVLAVRDRGKPFTIGTIALPEDPEAESGRGLYLISAFASPPVAYPRVGGGNEVVVLLVRWFDRQDW